MEENDKGVEENVKKGTKLCHEPQGTIRSISIRRKIGNLQ